MTQEHPEREPGEVLFRWTKHEDAYPDLSHCPSCGESVVVPWYDPFAGKPAEPVRCEQCDRDLRLPKDAVKDQLCLVCKVPEEEADAGVDYRRLETGERVCSNCLGDLRGFKFEMEQLTLLAEWVTDEHRADLNAALIEVADAHEKDYSFTADANARYGRMEPDPDRGLTFEDMIAEDADPEELPEEVRRSLEEAEDGE